MNANTKAQNEKITSYSENPIWTTFPSTIKWMQEQRNTIKSSDLPKLYFRSQGMNATIILLSAACVEGFLVECLSCFMIGSRFASKNTFEGRLEHDFLQRVSTATFGDFRELFRLTLGATISDLIKDAKLLEGIKSLISFRNGIAHARSVVYLAYAENPEGDDDFAIGNQYKSVYEYLHKEKLIFGQDDLFNSKVADHFAGLVRPYVEAVVALLPVPQSDNVKMLVKSAWKERE